MTLDEYIESTDSNLYWRLSSGEILNLLDEAIDRLEPENDELKTLQEIAIDEVKNRLFQTNYNITRVAGSLGISRITLYRWLEKNKLEIKRNAEKEM